MTAKRHYKDWYRYESRRTSLYEAACMAIFTAALVFGFPLMFAALYHYAIPFLAGLL